MPSITLKAGVERTIQTSGLYLSIINATGKFSVESPQFGAVVGEVGRQYELPGITQVTFVNPGDTDLDIEFETANIKVSASGKGIVTVGNEVIVKRIMEAIQVTASATVENGNMARLTGNQFAPLGTTTIPAGQTVKVVNSRQALNRLVTLQLVTDDPTMGEIRLGTTAGTAPAGIFVQGHKDAPGGYEWATEAAVYVHNPTGSPVTLAGGEQWRA